MVSVARGGAASRGHATQAEGTGETATRHKASATRNEETWKENPRKTEEREAVAQHSTKDRPKKTHSDAAQNQNHLDDPADGVTRE
jgi:hypothetical protein